MRRDFLSAVALAIVGFFVYTVVVFSANSDVVVNEIGAYENSGHEWIEIWNKGAEPVDMSGWKFWEDNTNHGLTASGTDSVIGPGEYAAICQNDELFLADHPAFSGSILDSSWGSLNENGEEIGLKDPDGNYIEQFSYIAVSEFSLERANPYEAIYDETNWSEHLSGNTIGLTNSIFTTSSGGAPTTTASTTPEISTSTPEVSTSTLWAVIKVNEFVSDPQSGNEWVELFNPSTSSLDIGGGLICDSRETSCKSTAGTIMAPGWLYIDLFTSSFLNNAGDSVILKNPEGQIVDRIDCSSALAPKKGQSLSRRSDGVDTDDAGDWAITTSITPGAENVITAPLPPPSGGGGNGSKPAVTLPATVVTTTITTTSITAQIIINEIFPNPSGADTADEFIEIKNVGDTAADLTGWKIGDSVKLYALSGAIPAQGIAYWLRPATNISLNNTSKEEVKLLSPAGQIVEIILYDSAPEGESYARNTSNSFAWTAEPTPGQENKFSAAESGIVWKISAPSSAEIGEMIIFNADDSADLRGGMLSYRWDFGDGMSAEGGEPAHAYNSSGTYAVTVFATSTLGSGGQKKINITIGAGLALGEAGVMVCELLPNPDGDDSGEFIELCNVSDKPVNLAGWSIKVKSKKFIFPNGTVIAPQSRLVFYRAATGLILDNTGGRVELADRDNNIVDLIKYEKGAAGASYAYAGEWRWSEMPTPGGENIFLVEIQKSDAAAPKKSGGSAATVYYRPLSIQEARQEDVDTGVIVRGTVVALPSVFGSQIFYIFDGSAGIQIYQYKKDFPDLATGDAVEIAGIISEARGIKRIKMKNRQAVDILETDKSIIAADLELDLIGEENTGSLVNISGEITEIKSSYMYLDNGDGEIKVYFKQGAGIDKKAFKEGDKVKITGVVELSGNEIQVWPRSNSDIFVVGPSEEAVKNELITSQNNSKEVAEKYFTATAGGLTALLLGFFGRAKGYLLKDSLKKIISLAAGFWRRG